MKKGYLILILVTVSLLILVVAEVVNYRQYYKYYSPYRLPGEFEKQQAIWMQWPSEIYNVNDHPVNPVIINIIKVSYSTHQGQSLGQKRRGNYPDQKFIPQKRFLRYPCSLLIVNHQLIWARDVGPIFVKDRQNQLHVVNFGFNNYSRGGDPYYISIESQVDKVVAGLPNCR